MYLSVSGAHKKQEPRELLMQADALETASLMETEAV